MNQRVRRGQPKERKGGFSGDVHIVPERFKPSTRTFMGMVRMDGWMGGLSTRGGLGRWGVVDVFREW